MNSLFSYLFTEFDRVILGGVRDYVGEVSGGKIEKTTRKKLENYPSIEPQQLIVDIVV